MLLDQHCCVATRLPHKLCLATCHHLAQNMEEVLPGIDMKAPTGLAPPICAFVAAGRGPNGGCGYNSRGGRGGRGLPNKCSGCGTP
jgi:hypothetical protein